VPPLARLAADQLSGRLDADVGPMPDGHGRPMYRALASSSARPTRARPTSSGWRGTVR
jgi:hypothetical protein